MKAAKKILSLVLALAMTASMGVSTLFAATTGNDTGEPFKVEFANGDVSLPAGSDKISLNFLAKGKKIWSGGAPDGVLHMNVGVYLLQDDYTLYNQLGTGKVEGIKIDPSVVFSKAGITVADKTEIIIGAEFNKSFTISITVPKENLPTEFTLDLAKIRIARAHYSLASETSSVTLLDANSKYAANGDLVIRFESDKFSVFQPVLADVKEEKTASDDRPEKKKLAEEWTHVPSGVVTDAERGETIRIKLTSGSLIPYSFIELAKDLDLKIEATYFDVVYKGDGKTFPTPPEGRVFYDTDEFLKMLKVSK